MFRVFCEVYDFCDVKVMLGDLTVRKWMVECGRSMIECILCVAGQNLEDFQEAFSKMMEYVDCNENWAEIESELKGRRVSLILS